MLLSSSYSSSSFYWRVCFSDKKMFFINLFYRYCCVAVAYRKKIGTFSDHIKQVLFDSANSIQAKQVGRMKVIKKRYKPCKRQLDSHE